MDWQSRPTESDRRSDDNQHTTIDSSYHCGCINCRHVAVCAGAPRQCSCATFTIALEVLSTIAAVIRVSKFVVVLLIAAGELDNVRADSPLKKRNTAACQRFSPTCHSKILCHAAQRCKDTGKPMKSERHNG